MTTEQAREALLRHLDQAMRAGDASLEVARRRGHLIGRRRTSRQDAVMTRLLYTRLRGLVLPPREDTYDTHMYDAWCRAVM